MVNSFMRIFLVMSLLITLSIPLSAQSLDYIYTNNNNVTINYPCFMPSGQCNQTTSCGIDVINRNGSVVTQNQAITGGSIISSNVLNIDSNTIYKSKISCSNTITNATETVLFYFGVNSDGIDYSNNYFTLFIIGAIFTLMALFFISAFMFEPSLKLPFLVLGFLMLPVGLWFALQVAANSFVGSAMVEILTWSFVLGLTSFFTISLYSLWKLTMGLTLNDNSSQGAKTTESIWGKKKKIKKEKQEKDYEDNGEFEDDD